jgi:hypothetical protein
LSGSKSPRYQLYIYLFAAGVTLPLREEVVVPLPVRMSSQIRNLAGLANDTDVHAQARRAVAHPENVTSTMHLGSAIKVDLIVRKNSEYRHVEFERRKSVEFAGVSTWITSREDLILSKLVWASDSGSEMQLRDVRTLIDDSVDWAYLKDWAAKLGVAAKLEEVSK